MTWFPCEPRAGCDGQCFTRDGRWFMQQVSEYKWQLFDGDEPDGVAASSVGDMPPERALGWADVLIMDKIRRAASGGS